jgi:hypothetical protein
VSSPFIIVPAITALSVTLWIYWSLFNISILSYQIIGININGTLNIKGRRTNYIMIDVCIVDLY